MPRAPPDAFSPEARGTGKSQGRQLRSAAVQQGYGVTAVHRALAHCGASHHPDCTCGSDATCSVKHRGSSQGPTSGAILAAPCPRPAVIHLPLMSSLLYCQCQAGTSDANCEQLQQVPAQTERYGESPPAGVGQAELRDKCCRGRIPQQGALHVKGSTMTTRAWGPSIESSPPGV